MLQVSAWHKGGIIIDSDIYLKIKALLRSQKLAVLSTLCESQPYCNLVAFAESEGSREVLFFTPKNTNKYENLVSNKRVALLVDNRTNQIQDFKEATAVTLIGTAEEIDIGKEPYLLDVFTAKHPNLADIIKNKNNALFKVNISAYIVATFDSTIRIQARFS